MRASFVQKFSAASRRSTIRARDEPDAVEPGRQEVEQHGQKRQRADDRDGRDDEARQPEAPHEGQRHGEHDREADRDRRAAEHDRSTGRLHRAHHGFLPRAPGPKLLPVAVDDEERVVDGDSEPDQHHEVLQVRRQLEEVGEDPDDAERGRNGGEREDERQQERERPEHEDEDEQRDRDGDEELADLEVVGEDRIEVVLDCRLAGHVDLGARDLADRLAHGVGVALGVRRLEVRDDRRRDDVVRDRLDDRDLARRQLCRGTCGGGLDLGEKLRRRARSPLGHNRERARRLLAEVLLEDRLGAMRVGAREREAVREQIAEAGHGPQREDEQEGPDGSYRPAPADHGERPAPERRVATGFGLRHSLLKLANAPGRAVSVPMRQLAANADAATRRPRVRCLRA